MKRFICYLLVVLIILTGISCAEQNKPTNTDGFVYKLQEDGSAVIVGYTGKEKKLSVPEQVNGHNVVMIGMKAFFEQTQLTEIIIPKSVKTIEGNAFYACSSLKKVVMEEGVEKLDELVFQECSELSDINLPTSLISIGDGLFLRCDALKTVKIDEAHPLLSLVDGVLFTKTDQRLLWYPISKADETYTIPDGTEVIGKNAFASARVTKVFIPESVETIASWAFSQCDSLKEINIPSQVEKLDLVFSGCSKLERIDVSPDNLVFQSVDGVLFQTSAHKLVLYPKGRKDTTYEIPYGTEIISPGACESAQFAEILIPETVRIIGNLSFAGTELKSLVLPEGVEELHSNPFRSCCQLRQVILPRSVKKIRGNPFTECERLDEIIIPEDHPALVLMDGALVVKEDMRLVWYPTSAKANSYTIPAGVRIIDSNSFSGCEALTKLTISEGVEKLNNKAINCQNLEQITLPESLTEIEKSSLPKNATCFVVQGSYAENFCQAYGLKYEYQ